MKVSEPLRNAPSQQTNVTSRDGFVVFEYTGRSRLIVIGPVTHTRYEFTGFAAIIVKSEDRVGACLLWLRGTRILHRKIARKDTVSLLMAHVFRKVLDL
jgi:hypothetical protein